MSKKSLQVEFFGISLLVLVLIYIGVSFGKITAIIFVYLAFKWFSEIIIEKENDDPETKPNEWRKPKRDPNDPMF